MSIQLNDHRGFIAEIGELPYHRFLTRFTILCISAHGVDLKSNNIEISYLHNIHATIAHIGVSCHGSHSYIR